MIEWITENYEVIIDIVAKVIAVAAAVSAITPSRVDNDILTKVLQFTNLLGLNILRARNSDES